MSRKIACEVTLITDPANVFGRMKDAHIRGCSAKVERFAEIERTLFAAAVLYREAGPSECQAVVSATWSFSALRL